MNDIYWDLAPGTLERIRERINSAFSVNDNEDGELILRHTRRDGRSSTLRVEHGETVHFNWLGDPSVPHPLP